MDARFKPLMDSLNDVAPDCFDCGLKVTDISLEEGKTPLTLSIDFKFDPYTGEDEEESVSVEFDGTVDELAEWSEKRSAFETEIIEAMGDVVDEFRD